MAGLYDQFPAAAATARVADPWAAFRKPPAAAPVARAPAPTTAKSAYRITTPTGEEYEVEAPDETTAVATLKQLLASPASKQRMPGADDPVVAAPKDAEPWRNNPVVMPIPGKGAAVGADPWADFRKPPAAAPADEWAAYRKPPAGAPPIVVNCTDGSTFSFPAGTDRATMLAALQRHYGAPAKDSTAVDVAKSAGTGVVRGVLGALGTIPAAVDAAHNAVDKYLLDPLLGAVPARDKAASIDLTPGGLESKLAAVAGPLHTPQTTAGKYAETVGEFAPSALVGPGGLARKAAEVALPAIASEAAGEATTGTKLEPYARIAAALGLGGAGALATGRTGAPERMIARSVQGQDPSVYQLAQALQDSAGRLGVPLSGPEAIQQVTGGATKLGDLQRVVEGSTEGGARTAPFYAARTGQVQGATGRVLDQVAPASLAPSTIGPQAAEAAQGVLDTTRRNINTATRPMYAAAEGHVIAPADFAPIGDDSAFQASLRRLRSDEVLGPRYAGQPDNSVGVVDAVTKDMRDRGIALGSAANPGFSSQTAAAYGTGAAEARDIARDPARGGSQAYDDALAAQEQARRQNLAPLEQGPLGRLAAASDTRAAYDALLPGQPLTGSHAEVLDAATRLAARDPAVVPQLVRQHLADAADQAARTLQSGPAQYAGANFVNAVAGTPQQRANLDAALSAAGRSTDLPALIEALGATGMRKPPGSATEFNRQVAADLASPSAAVEIGRTLATGGLNALPWMGKVGDKLNRAYLGRNTGRLGDILLAPDSASQIGAIAARGAESPLAALFGRSALQAPGEARAR